MKKKKKILLGSVLFVLLGISLYRGKESREEPEYVCGGQQEENVPQTESDRAVPDETDGEEKIITRAGILTYFSQGDPRWAHYQCAGQDPMEKYGCGPTVLAMLVSSFTEQELTPAMAAEWAADHGYYVAGEGSRHQLIPEGTAAFGMSSRGIEEPTKEQVIDSLNSGKLLVALVGPGHFTQKGHFLIITSVYDSSHVWVADPARPENNRIIWKTETILAELKNSAEAGGPLWEIDVS